MPTSQLEATEVRTVLSAAAAAPSVHNTQPWRFRVRGQTIDLLADRDRQLQAQDPDGRALLMSCGAALLNLRVAAELLFGAWLSGNFARVLFPVDGVTVLHDVRPLYEGGSANAAYRRDRFPISINRLPISTTFTGHNPAA